MAVKIKWFDQPQATPSEMLLAVGWDEDTDGLPSNDDDVFFYSPKHMNKEQVLHEYNKSNSPDDWYIVLDDPDYVLETELVECFDQMSKEVTESLRGLMKIISKQSLEIKRLLRKPDPTQDTIDAARYRWLKAGGIYKLSPIEDGGDGFMWNGIEFVISTWDKEIDENIEQEETQ